MGQRRRDKEIDTQSGYWHSLKVAEDGPAGEVAMTTGEKPFEESD